MARRRLLSTVCQHSANKDKNNNSWALASSIHLMLLLIFGVVGGEEPLVVASVYQKKCEKCVKKKTEREWEREWEREKIDTVYV